MKQIIILILLLTAYCLSFGQGDVKPPNETDLQTQITAMPQGDSAIKAFINGQKFLWYNAAQGLQKRDSSIYTTRYFLSQNYSPLPTITTNYIPYWTGTAYGTSNLKYSTSGPGRIGIGFGSSTLIDNGLSLDSANIITQYNTLDHTTDFQRVKIGYQVGTNNVLFQAASGGAAAQQIILISSNSKTIALNGNTATNSSVVNVDPGTISTAGRAGFGVGGTLTTSGGTLPSMGIISCPTASATSNGNITSLAGAFFESGNTTSGKVKLLDLFTSSAANGQGTQTSFFYVTKAGQWALNNVEGSANQVPISNGTTMGWGLISNANITNATIDLTTKITGVLPIANGGIGGATAAANTVFGNNTGGSAAPAFQTSLALSGTGSFLGFVGAGIASPAALLHLSGNISAANSGASGINFRTDAATYNNTTSSGTVASYAVNVFGQPTLTATSSTTYTLGSTVTIIGAPISSTNVGQTASVALSIPSGMASFQGGFSTGTSLSGSNLSGGGGSGLSSSTNASLLFGGASTIQARAWANGTTSTVATANTSIANFIVGAATATEATSGVHSVITNMAVLAPTVTNGSATTTDATSLYIQGPLTGITPTNPATAMWVASGTARFDGNATFATGISLGLTGKISIAEGTNASVGQATLVGGTVTVSTTAVTANSRIFLTDATTGALTNIGTPTVGTIVAGTSFVINSTNVLDASKVNWFIIN